MIPVVSGEHSAFADRSFLAALRAVIDMLPTNLQIAYRACTEVELVLLSVQLAVLKAPWVISSATICVLRREDFAQTFPEYRDALSAWDLGLKMDGRPLLIAAMGGGDVEMSVISVAGAPADG